MANDVSEDTTERNPPPIPSSDDFGGGLFGEVCVLIQQLDNKELDRQRFDNIFHFFDCLISCFTLG